MKKVCILDYGMGNIRSLKNSIKKIGYSTVFYSDKNEINSNLLIIPGVGAFNSAMNIWKEKKIDDKIKTFLTNKDNNILGICLGKQLLYTKGSENGNIPGLNLISGKVDIISDIKNYKLPNVGWKKINVKKNLGKFGFLTEFNQQKFYFIHSFIGKPNDEKNILATSEYKDINFCSVSSNHQNLIGVQFHPEKSGDVGLNFLKSTFENLN